MEQGTKQIMSNNLIILTIIVVFIITGAIMFYKNFERSSGPNCSTATISLYKLNCSLHGGEIACHGEEGSHCAIKNTK